MKAALALRSYRLFYVAYIIYLSARTFVAADEHPPGAGVSDHIAQLAAPDHLRILAGAEIVAALAFLFRGAEIYAGLCLLAIYAIAMALALASAHFAAPLIFYAATVLLFFATRDGAGAEHAAERRKRLDG